MINPPKIPKTPWIKITLQKSLKYILINYGLTKPKIITAIAPLKIPNIKASQWKKQILQLPEIIIPPDIVPYNICSNTNLPSLIIPEVTTDPITDPIKDKYALILARIIFRKLSQISELKEEKLNKNNIPKNVTIYKKYVWLL